MAMFGEKLMKPPKAAIEDEELKRQLQLAGDLSKHFSKKLNTLLLELTDTAWHGNLAREPTVVMLIEALIRAAANAAILSDVINKAEFMQMCHIVYENADQNIRKRKK
jgi:hypothetical protein